MAWINQLRRAHAARTPQLGSGVPARFTLMLSIIAAAAAAICANSEPAPLPTDAKVDLLVVEKANHKLLAYSHGALLRSYSIALGGDSSDPKSRQGDRRTPEGRYFIDAHNANSSFHRALHVSYPSAADIERARAAGYDPGGDIMVHGIHNGLGWIGRAHRLMDWTAGCVAVTDPEIEELYRVVPDGTQIDLRP
jgi:murein L,D-transpeptidase YafK